MGHLTAAIQNLSIAQQTYEAARVHCAPAAELIVLAEVMRQAIIAHGEAMQAIPRIYWQAEVEAALAA